MTTLAGSNSTSGNFEVANTIATLTIDTVDSTVGVTNAGTNTTINNSGNVVIPATGVVTAAGTVTVGIGTAGGSLISLCLLKLRRLSTVMAAGGAPFLIPLGQNAMTPRQQPMQKLRLLLLKMK